MQESTMMVKCNTSGNFRRILSTLLLPILLFTFLSGLTGCGKSDQIELRLAHFFPGTHPAETDFIQTWAKKVSEATDGKVKITSYPAQSLLKAPDIYNGVVKGVADIGLSCFAYTRGRFPVLEAFELPGIIYSNASAASMTAWEGIQQLQPKEVQDTHLLMVIATGPGHLFSKVPIKKLADLQGLEMRATGLSAKTLKTLGAVPNGMPQSETYEALSRGVVKGNLSPLEVLKGWKQAEVVDHVTMTPFLYNTLFFVTMNKKKWESLPEELQNKISKVTETFLRESAIGLWDRQNEGVREWAEKEHDIEFITLPAEESARWIEKVMPIQKAYSAKIAEKNLAGGKDVLSLVKELAAKYNKEYSGK